MTKRSFAAFVLVMGLGLGSSVHAAYQPSVTFTSGLQDASGLHLVFVFTGNAGEPPVTFAVTIADPGANVSQYVNNALWAQLQTLNRQENVLAGLPIPGTAIAVSAPVTPASTVGSFTAASAAFTPGTTPQDVCAISGSATKSVSVTGVQVSSTQTTAGMNGWSLVKRSTLNTGGTSTALTAVPTGGAVAATATVRTYTVNPTAGTVIGSLWSSLLPSPAPASAVSLPLTNMLPVTSLGLGATEVLALNFSGAALPSGLSVRCVVQWSEQ